MSWVCRHGTLKVYYSHISDNNPTNIYSPNTTQHHLNTITAAMTKTVADKKKGKYTYMLLLLEYTINSNSHNHMNNMNYYTKGTPQKKITATATICKYLHVV